MDHSRINTRIIDVVRGQSHEDDVVSEFLVGLIWRESETRFRWKDVYKKAIQKAAENWSEGNEN